MNQRRMTISDVAELAGVSYQTVSRVINNKPDVSASTRQRIQDIIAETGYRPSRIARSLVTAHTATIGLIVPDISNPFFSAIARGVEQVASAQGYTVILCSTSEDVSRELEILHMLDERYVDGVIVCGLREEDTLLQKALSPFRAVVLVNRRLADETIPAIMVNDVLGGYMAVQHLLKLGHTDIGFMAGPISSYSSARRLQGYEQALAEAGIVHPTDWVQHCIPTVAGGETAAHSLLTNHPELSALFCHNDLVAVGAMRNCMATGRRVPEDMAIVGFDDIMLASLMSPSLTTCHVPRVEIGSQAVSMLFDCMKDDVGRCQEIVIDPELVVRASTVGRETAVLNN